MSKQILHRRIFKDCPSKIRLLSADIGSFVAKLHKFGPILVLVKDVRTNFGPTLVLVKDTRAEFGTLLVLVNDVRASTPGEVAIYSFPPKEIKFQLQTRWIQTHFWNGKTKLSSWIKCERKHCKNCECCPVSLLIVRSQWLSWIQVLNCLKCQRFHTSSEAMSCICPGLCSCLYVCL